MSRPVSNRSQIKPGNFSIYTGYELAGIRTSGDGSKKAVAK
jgi:hypothetical protein